MRGFDPGKLSSLFFACIRLTSEDKSGTTISTKENYWTDWAALALAVVSSGTKYEVARRIADSSIAVAKKYKEGTCTSTSASLLSILTNSGHRYPNKMSAYLHRSLVKYSDMAFSFSEMRTLLGDEEIMRRHLVGYFPGLGYKQASMLLRDLGLANNLAVIDTHVVKFASMFVEMPGYRGTSQSYLECEVALQEFATGYGISLASLDRAIWASMAAIHRGA